MVHGYIKKRNQGQNEIAIVWNANRGDYEEETHEYVY